MVEIKIGDRIKDNDPRMGNRVLRIIAVSSDGSVSARSVHGRTTVSIATRRIYANGKPRKSGFTLISGVAGNET